VLNDYLGWASPTNAVPDGGQCSPCREWEVPIDFPADRPEAERKPFDAYHALLADRHGHTTHTSRQLKLARGNTVFPYM
jgi:hypothetical protein